MANVQVPVEQPIRDTKTAPGGLFSNKILDSVFNYDDSELTEFRSLAHPSSTLFRYLLHHCVIELEFSRAYKPRNIVITQQTEAGRFPRGYITKQGLSKRERLETSLPNVLLEEKEYRQRRANAGPLWMGAPKRRMLCTLDEFFLGSQDGRMTFAYSGDASGKYLRNRRPRKNARAWNPRHPAVWDLIWKDWREIPTDQTVKILAVFPTSMGLHDLTRRSKAYRPTPIKIIFTRLAGDQPHPGGERVGMVDPADGTDQLPDAIEVEMWNPAEESKEFGRGKNQKLIETQMAVFREIYKMTFSKMSITDRYRYMDGNINLDLQSKIRRLQKLMAQNKTIQEGIQRIAPPQLTPDDKKFIMYAGGQYGAKLNDGRMIYLNSLGTPGANFYPEDLKFIYTRRPDRHVPPPE